MITATVDDTSTLLAVGSADGAIKIYDIQGAYITHTFRGSSGVVSALHFFELAVPPEPVMKSKKKGKRRRDEAEYEELEDGAPGDDKHSTIHLASGSEDGKIRIWSLSQRKAIATLDSHVSVVRDIDFLSEEKILLSGGRDKTVILWNASTWKPIKTIPILETVEACGFISSQYVYTGGENGTLRIWNARTTTEVTEEQETRLESEAMLQVLWNPGQSFLLSIHADQSLVMHSTRPLSTGNPDSIQPLPVLRRISGTHDEIIDLAYVGPQRSMMALATNSENVKLISVEPTSQRTDTAYSAGKYFGADVASLSGHSDIVICLSVDWSGCWLATGSKDNTAKVWRIDAANGTSTCAATLQGHTESTGAVCLPSHPPIKSPNSPLNQPPLFLLTGSQDRTIKRWDLSKLPVDTSPSTLSSNSQPRTLYTRKAHDKDINAIALSPLFPLFATASQDRTIKIYDLEKGEVQGILRGHKRGVWSVAFSPQGTPSLGSSGIDGNSTSPARGYLLSGSGDRTLKIWSLGDYSCLRTFEGHAGAVLKVLWLPRTQQGFRGEHEAEETSRRRDQDRPPQIASSAGDGLVKIWDALSGEVATTLDNHTDRVWALAVRPPPALPSPSPDNTSKSTSISTSQQPTTNTPTSSSNHEALLLVSGAADATLTFWRDTASQTISRRSARQSKRVEQDQRLENLIHGRNYREGITLALQMNYPGKLLALFREVFTPQEGNDDDDADAVSTAAGLDAALRNGNRSTGVVVADETTEKPKRRVRQRKEVEDIIAHLSPTQLLLLLQRVRDWNTNARTCGLAQRILDVVLRRYPLGRLVEMANARPKPRSVATTDAEDHGDVDEEENGSDQELDTMDQNPGRRMSRDQRRQGNGWKEVIHALRVYTERHYKRVEEVGEEAWVVEWMWREMGGYTGGVTPGGKGERDSGQAVEGRVMNGTANGSNGTNGVVVNPEDEDVIML